MKLPDYKEYKDIHQGMLGAVPELRMESIKEYLSLFDKKWEDKYIEMYEERYIRYVRLFSDHLPAVYLSASVWAEMSKGSEYKVDVCLQQETGVVEEAQCECGAGQGPSAHCKHVVTVLYGVLRFHKDKTIISEQTCTTVLQTFHRAKANKGSPMVCTTLQKLRSNQNLDYDPRPACSRNIPVKEKMDRVKNLCINHQIKRPMPMMQLFTPANPLALTMDHDYCSGYDTDRFLESEKITSITQGDVDFIEKTTRKQAQSDEWKRQRQLRLTSSNFHRICRAVRVDKKCLAKEFTMQKDLRMPSIVHGRKYEPVAIRKFEEMSGLRSQSCGMFVCPEVPFLAASPDALIVQDHKIIVVEVKCPFSKKDDLISPVNIPYLERDPNSTNDFVLKKSHSYYYQVQGQMLCTGASSCYFVIFTLQDLKYIVVLRDDEFIVQMKGKLVEFFEDYFKEAVINSAMYRNYFDFCFET